MNEELREYLNTLFEEAPKTKAAYELKEELITNSNERYFDLVESGIPEKEALHIVIDSIGDIDQLIDSVKEPNQQISIDDEKLKKKALFKTIAIGLYIFGFIMMLIFEEFVLDSSSSLGFIILLLFSAIATCILVYENTAYPTKKYKKTEDTVVENFKEWNTNKQVKKEIKNSMNIIIWMATLVAYFIISFATTAWYITWVIFLIGICVQAIANLLFQLKMSQE